MMATSWSGLWWVVKVKNRGAVRAPSELAPEIEKAVVEDEQPAETPQERQRPEEQAGQEARHHKQGKVGE
jgi:hypothetical protein